MDWLRLRLGFQGVVVSDDLNMGALPQDLPSWKEALIESVRAGCDVLLVCRHLERYYAALDALRSEAKRCLAFKTRLEDAAIRATKLRKSL
jgi:beta-N-acetylhexosaminidase